MGALGLMNSNGGLFFISPDPAASDKEGLLAAEKAGEQVVNSIHPTLDSEEKRRDVIDYLQRLIKTHLNCEVFPYGSVPLKTYLPDGDIDLTVIRSPNRDEPLGRDLLAIFQREEQNQNVEFQVKDTQFIDAEVKIVKCLVRNKVIDISFNQLGGLSTLCFLEQVDQLIGRNHFFKRSIILIKSWCYYESRILGATHGLISTYALETLILYIFNRFHSSLTGPLSVLHKFLDYYSQFDWENYCISLKGPVSKSSLPNIVVNMPESELNDPLLTDEFIESCIEMFSVPSRDVGEANPKPFQTKHLNIIDPMKENNNLGRSVNKGNFYRIRCAFKYGARKLGQILLKPSKKIAHEICEFFGDTLERHGNNSKSNNIQEFGDEDSLSSHVEMFSEDDIMLTKSYVSDFDTNSVDSISAFEDDINVYSSNGEISSDPASSSGSGSSHKANNMLENMSLIFKKMDLSELEAINPLANLTGDYDSHIRSFLYGHLNRGFSVSSPAVVASNPPSIPRIQTEQSYPPSIPRIRTEQIYPPSIPRIQTEQSLDFIPQSMPPPIWQSNQFSIMNTQVMYMEPTVYLAAPDPALHIDDGRPMLRGTGTYIPHMVNDFYQERSFRGRGRGNRNHHPRHRRNNNHGFYPHPNFSRSNSFENGTNELRRNRQGRGSSGTRSHQSHFPIGDANQTNGYLNAPCRIEFGSIGNLAEEVISKSEHIRGPTPVMRQERVSGSSVRVMNDIEFPPLCQ